LLSIAKISGTGQGDYYLNLASEDYYLKGGEPPGKWYGEGAKELGLTGEVKSKDFRNLLSGHSPDGKEKLVQNAGVDNRQSSWDLTFSAPKTVSVAWSQSEGEQRKAFQEVHGQAVQAALNYLEDEAAVTRRGKGGEIKEKASLAVATFEHGTSRAQDPNLHTHALVMNVAVREDGTTGTLQSKDLFQSKMAAGAVYRAELAKGIEQDNRLGFETKKYRSWFEIEGVSGELKDEFSKRRKDVEAALEEAGMKGAKASKIAALNTRESKEEISRENLFSDWRETGEKLGFSTRELGELKGEIPKRNEEAEKLEAFNNSVQKLTDSKAHFSRRDLVRAVAEEAQGRGLGAEEVFQTIAEQIKNNDNIVELGRVSGEQRFSTKEMLALEKGMIDGVERSKHSGFKLLKDVSLESVFKKREGISDEQKEAVRHITQRQGSVQAVSGMAGTGKSFMLGAAKEAWEAEGLTVRGAALSGKAASGLQEGSGIQSDTIHKTLYDLDSGRLSLNKNSVLVIDEAAMVGTRQMAKLVQEAERAGAKLVLVGDARQLQAVEAGGAFKAISERVGEAKLSTIRRQDEKWSREVVQSFAAGDARAGLKEFAKRGQLHVEATGVRAEEKLIKHWRGQGVEKPEENLILAGTNLEASELNKKAQLARFSAGKLGEDSVSVNSERVFSGDRILFTKNSRLLGVKNGDLGEVTSIDSKTHTLFAKLDNKRTVRVQLEDYNHLKLGYAVTTHKAQGTTTNNSFILAGGMMQDRELSYVQVSRAKGKTQIYTSEAEAGENLTELSKQMSKSRQKDLASDVLPKVQRQEME